MNVAVSGQPGGSQTREASDPVRGAAATPERDHRGRGRGSAFEVPHRYASDDEILGLDAPQSRASGSAARRDAEAQSRGEETGSEPANADADAATIARPSGDAEADPREAALDAHPELRQAWQDAQSYREAFATPAEARAATALLGDLDRMDALFFSRRPEDHAELARAVASLDPIAFASLATAMGGLAANNQKPDATSSAPGSAALSSRARAEVRPDVQPNARPDEGSAVATEPTAAQMEFLHATNAAAVQGVIDAIETQVDRLLPEGVSKAARHRVVGEIYRELDAMLGSNRQVGQQLRDAVRSGNLGAAHQRAVVSLVTGRARQALPAVAKRVLNEWTSTVVAANQDRLARQRAAAHRVDIAGSGRGGDGGRRSLGPRDIDYARMSDSDILNL